MKRTRWICAVLALVLLLAGTERLTRDRRDVRAACTYLQGQKYDEADPEAVPARTDPINANPDGRVVSMRINSSQNIDLLLSCVERAEGVRRVEIIPDLDPPRVSCGDCLRGSWERLYYTDPASRRITEFTLTRADSMRLALCLVPCGPTPPQIVDLYASELEDCLQSRMPEEGEDQFKIDENGYLESVNIRTQETLDRYLDCVRNCSSIQDRTDALCGIYALPPAVRVAGRDACNCEYVTYTSPSTGRYIAFCLRQEDSQDFVDYLAQRAGARSQTMY